MQQRLRLLTMLMLLALYFVGIGAPSQSYAFEDSLSIQNASPSEIKGTFTLILYGAGQISDLETIAILDVEGDGYRFEPYAPDFNFTVQKGIPADKALSAAEKFVSYHADFWQTRLSKIIDGRGNIIGFEVRPLYSPFVYGVSDVMEVHYFPEKDGRVKMTIKLIPSADRLKYPGGGGGAGQ